MLAHEAILYIKERGIVSWKLKLEYGEVRHNFIQLGDETYVKLIARRNAISTLELPGMLPINVKSSQLKELFEMLTDEKFVISIK